MPSHRRLFVLVLVALGLAAPAVALRLLCVGRSCSMDAGATTRVPFCSLPQATRDLVAAGFRDGRGPHVLAVAGESPVRGAEGIGALPAPWPATGLRRADRVPLAFAGTGAPVRPDIPEGTTLDAVAPTIAEIIRLDRPHPGVRSGRAIPGVAGTTRPRLVLLVVWKGVGSADLEARPDAWPNLRGAMAGGGGTLDARVGSLPVDPAAVEATIGTGGLPRDHGITGAVLRNDRGRAVTAWGPRAPFSVIAALGDDLDELNDQEARIGLVGTQIWDRGLIGGTWYIESDRDDHVLSRGPRRQVAAVEGLLSEGYGGDGVPDLLAVAMQGPVPALDRALGSMAEAAAEASRGRLAVVITATGSADRGSAEGVTARQVEATLEADLGDVVEATAVGGLFLDQEAMQVEGVTDDGVIRAARRLEGPGGGSLFDDVFPQIAVTFARYC
ncbi:MAG: hypothetical protein ACRDKA_11220 [Actinomycetota bacterium]